MKGTILDLIPMLVILLVFAISTVMGYTILSEYQATSSSMGVSQIGVTQGLATIQGLDTLFVFLTFGLGIALIVGAYVIDVHPIFFIASLFALVFITIISGQLTNVYLTFASTGDIIQYASNFTMMETIFHNLPVITMLFGIISAIVIFGKMRGGCGLLSYPGHPLIGSSCWITSYPPWTSS